MALPQGHSPGTVFFYDNGAIHLLAAGLQRAVGGDLLKYAADHGLNALWPKDPEGVPYGFGGAQLSPRALLRFGEGWRTGTIFAPSYREHAWTAYSQGDYGGYGYLWWIGPNWRAAIGYGGQCVFIAPEKQTTIVLTGSRDQWRDGFSQTPLSIVLDAFRN